MPHLIDHRHQHFLLDARLAPVLTVKPGAEVTFQTLDACCGEVRSVEQFLARRKTDRPSNPMTGPVFVEGAEPGHTLVVEILNIQLDPDGFQLIGPQRAIIQDEIKDWTCYAFQVRGDRVIFPNGLEVPVDPVIGQFGNAPAGEPTSHPNPLGGNQDCPAVRTGVKLYLPVAVKGALFSLGDVHACQGDGEVVGAPEIGARVTVRIELLPHPHSPRYMIEDATHWHTCGTGETEAEAVKVAVFANAHFIEQRYGLAWKDALILLTLIGRLNVSRTAKWGTQGPVVCSSFSKELAEKAATNYRQG